VRENQHDDGDHDRADVPAEQERTDRPGGREDRLGQRVESMDRCRRERDESLDELGVGRVEIVGPDDSGR